MTTRSLFVQRNADKGYIQNLTPYFFLYSHRDQSLSKLAYCRLSDWPMSCIFKSGSYYEQSGMQDFWTSRASSNHTWPVTKRSNFMPVQKDDRNACCEDYPAGKTGASTTPTRIRSHCESLERASGSRYRSRVRGFIFQHHLYHLDNTE